MINATSAHALNFRSLAAAAPVPPKPQPDPEPFHAPASLKHSFGLSKLQQRLIDEDPIELRKGGRFAAQLIPPEDEMGRKLNLGREAATPPEDEVIANKAALSPEDELIQGGRIAEVPPEDEMIRKFDGDLRPAEFQPLFDEDDRRPQLKSAAPQVLDALQLANLVRQFSVR